MLIQICEPMAQSSDRARDATDCRAQHGTDRRDLRVNSRWTTRCNVNTVSRCLVLLASETVAVSRKLVFSLAHAWSRTMPLLILVELIRCTISVFLAGVCET